MKQRALVYPRREHRPLHTHLQWPERQQHGMLVTVRQHSDGGNLAIVTDVQCIYELDVRSWKNEGDSSLE